MATYKYQQNFYDGSSAGYVKYNISPDLGTYISPGESFTITGQVYCKGHAVKTIGLMLCADSDTFSSSGIYEAATKDVNVSKGKVGTFSITTAFYNDISRLDSSGGRAFSAYIQFDISDGESSDGTVKSTSQAITVLKTRLAPTITSVNLVDNGNEKTLFGKFVQNETPIYIEYIDSVDSVDPAVTIASRTLDFDNSILTIGDSGSLIGTCTTAGTIAWTYTITDSKGKSSSLTGTIEVANYTEPSISTLTATRYTVVTDDEGNVSYVASDDGEYVWFGVSGVVTSLNGANGWTLKCENKTVLSGSDGSTFEASEDRSMYTDAITLSADVTFTFVLADYYHSVTKEVTVPKAGAYFNIEKTGVGVGMRTTGTADNPKFESAWAAHFYDGIYDADGNRLDGYQSYELTDDDLSEYFTVAGTWGGYTATISRFGKVCVLSGQLIVKKQYTSTSQQVCVNMPSWAQPIRHQDIWTQSRYAGDYDIRQRIFSDRLQLYVQYSTSGTTNKGPAAGKMINLFAVWICA